MDAQDEVEAQVEAQDIAEVVDDDAPIEIDMTNNSAAYFDEHGDSVYFIASHPTLPLVATGGGDETLYLWTSVHNPPRVAAKLADPTESVISGAFTKDGHFLVIGDMSGRLIVYHSKNGERWTKKFENQEVEEIVKVVVHPTLNLAAVSSTEGQVWVYELGDDIANVAVLSAHNLPVTDMLFLPTEQPRLLSVSEDSRVLLWDVYTQQQEYSLDSTNLKGEHPWINACLSPTGNTAAVASMDGFVAIIKLADGALLHMLDTTQLKREKPIEPAAGDDDDDDEENGGDEALGYSIEGLDWSSTGLLATGNVDGIVAVWDTKTWRPRFQFELGDAVTQLEFVPGTRLLTVSSLDGSVVQYDVISTERVWEMLGHGDGVLGFVVQNNGKKVITAGDDHVCLVFDSVGGV